jgi:3-deoxy-manno-octulosonate cytidylyltransferase (CMP-KDO synthetase)
MSKTTSKAKVVGIIPARLKSSRIQQKALLPICGVPLVIHVLKRVQQSLDLSDVYVATDSEKIASLVEDNGGKAIMTSVKHKNGTERTTEAIRNIDGDVFVQIMGDEVLLNPEHIKVSLDALKSSEGAAASMLVTEFKKENSIGDFKVVTNCDNEIMYISRGDIPCSKKNPVDYRLKAYHITSWKRSALEAYRKIQKTPMEKIEDHEFLRLIENGYKIVTKKVESECISLDHEEDIEYITKKMLNDKFFKEYKKI